MNNKKIFVALAIGAAIAAPGAMEEVKAATEEVSLQDYLLYWNETFRLTGVQSVEGKSLEVIDPKKATFRIGEEDLNKTYLISFTQDGYGGANILLRGTMDNFEVIELERVAVNWEETSKISEDAEIVRMSPGAGYVEMEREVGVFLVEKPFKGMLIELSDGNVAELSENTDEYGYTYYSAKLTEEKLVEDVGQPYEMTKIMVEDVKVISAVPSDLQIVPTDMDTVMILSEKISNKNPLKLKIPSGQPAESLFLNVADYVDIPVAYSEKEGTVVVTLHQDGMLFYNKSQVTVKDSKGSSYAQYIDKLANRGIIQPDTSGNFYPNQVIKRYEFAEMLGKALGLAGQADVDTKFKDLTVLSAKPYIIALNELGVINGQAETKFGEQGSLTRQQGFAILGRYLEKLGHTVDPAAKAIKGFKDYEKISSDMRPYISLLVEIGAVQGKNGNLIDPHNAFTRGQMTKVLSIILEGEGLL